MNTYKCPVCGKQGISNYLKDDIVCPHCGSDLKIYRQISELTYNKSLRDNKLNKYKILTIVLPLIIIAVASIPFYRLYNRENYYTQYEECKNYLVQLTDSLTTLHTQIQEVGDAKDNQIIYIVVQNDSPWKIIRKLYGNRSDWEDLAKNIAIENGIWDETTKNWKKIHPGQTLKIRNIK